MTKNTDNDETDFLLKRKNKILEKLKLEKGDESFTIRKALLLSTVLWLPMLFLHFLRIMHTTAQSRFILYRTMLYYARFFVALPMLFYTQKTVQFQSNNTIKYFLDSGIISDNNIEDFQEKLKRIMNLRDSKTPKIIILVFAYIIVFHILEKF